MLSAAALQVRCRYSRRQGRGRFRRIPAARGTCVPRSRRGAACSPLLPATLPAAEGTAPFAREQVAQALRSGPAPGMWPGLAGRWVLFPVRL